MNRVHNHFGPWTTALHHTSRLELSSFWKQRLSRLSSLRHLPTRLPTRQFFAFAIIAVALLMVPRFELQRVAIAHEPSPLIEVPPAADELHPFTATFSNGVKIELIGLSENPSKDKSWWTPDGSPLAVRPYARVPAKMGGDPGTIGREVCWRWINKPNDPNFETKWMTIPHYGGAGGGTAFDTANKIVDGLTAWAIQMPDSPGTCTLQYSVSVSYTPWKTVFSADGKNQGAMGRSDTGVGQGAIFSQARSDDNHTAITVSYRIPDQAVRVVAIDQDGKVHAPGGSNTSGAMGFNQSTYQFTNLPLDQIKRFELQAQTRTFETIEFRNVSLDPGKRTDVEIVRLPPEELARKTAALGLNTAQFRPATAATDTIQPGQGIVVRAVGVLPDSPIADIFLVEPSGKIALGPAYGRTPSLTGTTLEQAESVIRGYLAQIVEKPEVMVTRPIANDPASVDAFSGDAPPAIRPGDVVKIVVVGTLPDAPIADRFRVEPTGKVPLGPLYGRVKIAGLTFEEAEAAITEHLRQTLNEPKVQVTDGGWELPNSALR